MSQTRYVLTKKKREGHLLHTQVSWGKIKGAGFVLLQNEKVEGIEKEEVKQALLKDHSGKRRR